MSNNNKNDTHGDPFAGQYPTPPPPPESYIPMAASSNGTPPAVNVTAAATTFYATPVVHQPQTGYFPQEQEHPWPTTSAYSHSSQPLPVVQQQEYFPPPSQYDHHRASYDHSATAAIAAGGIATTAYDPHRASYDPGAGYDPHPQASFDHRASYDPVYNHPSTTATTSYQHQQNDPSTYYPHPNTNYYTEDLDGPTSPNTPIIPKTEPAAVNNNNNNHSSSNSNNNNTNDNNNEQTSDQQQDKSKRNHNGGGGGGGFGWFKKKQRVESTPSPQQQPILGGPRPAPEDEKPSYQRPTIKDEEDGRGLRNACCCYNPALTCCSFFWMLFSIAILAGGIAMMIASKIVQDRCNNECGGSSEQTLSNCTVLCNNTLHQALLWAGVGITVLAGISVIWRLFTWCCAGCARNK
ncbi:hypothetical protein BDA99DRAFT_532938 [Phascolomyces articulosus]|uniref:Uncharacterized protein n=1 Tax=Phascolomyces articulosus TaxID=60185 RepID=A0AAD5K812_9FUNG|nr:hypothetical protein BDA99DRAFT_532938 [Phascolomyces articulosus]